MLNFFKKKDVWGNGYSIWVLAALLFAAPFLFSVLKQTRMNNEVEAWLPERDPQALLLKWYNESFPIQDKLFFSWDDSSLDDPRAELFAARLEGYVDEKGIFRRGSPYVSEVLTPQESLVQMRAQNLEVETAIDSLTGLLVGEGALKVRLSESARTHRAEIESEIQQRAKAELDIEVDVLPAYAVWQPPAEFADVASIKQQNPLALDPDADPSDELEREPLEVPEIAPHDFRLTWHQIKPNSPLTTQLQQIVSEVTAKHADSGEGESVSESFFTAGTPISLVVTLTDAGSADRATALEDIERIAAESFIPTETIHMGGRPIGSAMLNQEVAKATFDPDGPWYLRSVIGFSTLVSFLLAFLMVRSFRLGLLVLTTSLYATLSTVALIPLSGSTMNMVLIVMPTLLSVLTLSGAIHLVSYWKHAYQENPQLSIINAVRMAAQPCFLASATTAIGLASLMTSTLNPVRDFGIFAATGCGVSLVFVLFVLPSLMQVWPGRAEAEKQSDGRNWTRLADGVISHSTLVVLLGVGMFGFGLYGFRYFQTETKIVRYFPEGARILTDYWFLEDHILGVNTVDTIVRFDTQSQEDLTFLDRMEIVNQVAQKVKSHPEISGAISLADFQKTVPKPADDAPFFKRIGYNKRNNELESRIKSGEIEAANSMFNVAKKDTDWLAPGDGRLSLTGDELWRVSGQAYVMADNDYGLMMDQLEELSGSVLDQHAGVSHSVTGMVPVFLRTQEALLESLIWSFGMAFGIIAVVMIVLLRSLLAGLLTMLPNLMPVAFCFGTMSMMGMSVDIGTMITASVALGIAVDGTLHLLTWYKQGIRSGKSQNESIELALSHCAPAMWQTSAIVAIALLLLAPSSLLMISRFGVLMAALIGAALIADIIFLPALLAGLLGRIIERSELRRMRSTATATVGSNTSAGQQGGADAEVAEVAGQSAGARPAINRPHHSNVKAGVSDEIEAR